MTRTCGSPKNTVSYVRLYSNVQIMRLRLKKDEGVEGRGVGGGAERERERVQNTV